MYIVQEYNDWVEELGEVQVRWDGDSVELTIGSLAPETQYLEMEQWQDFVKIINKINREVKK